MTNSLNQTEWAEVRKSYKLLSQIGEGGYGIVVKAKCLKTGESVAIKHMTDFNQREYSTRKVLREIQIMRAIQKLGTSFFPRLLNLIVSEDCKDVFFIMELEKTDIRTLLHSSGKIEFEEDHAKHIMYNILCAAHFMESANIMHRDLKPGNILMNDQC